MATAALRLGQVLFRFRSFTPLPVLAVLVWLLWRSRGTPGPGGPEVDAWLNGVGLAAAAAGQALRFYTLGQVPEGTSGQGSALEARTLNTQGPYAWVRNPLYLGNLGICLGLMFVAHDAWVYALGLAFFFGEYFFIIRAEEDFLSQQFAGAYAAYQARVPRWVPRRPSGPTEPLRSGFDWRRALYKEHNPFAAWGSGALVLLAWERAARGELSSAWLAVLAGMEIAVLVVFLGVKAAKHRWLT